MFKLAVAAFVIATLGLFWRGGWPRPARTLWTVLLALSAGAIASSIAYATVEAVRHPPLLDFIAFWIFGTAAVHFHIVYDGAALRAAAALPALAQTIPHYAISIFTEEILDPGMVYPPPSVLLFYPLGYFQNVHHAALAWWLFNDLALFTLIVVVWRQYFTQTGGLPASLVVVAGFVPVLLSLQIGQTTILMTLFAMLFVVDRNQTRGGIWLALAVVSKPVALFLALYPLVKRQYRAVCALAVTLVVLTAAAIPVIGIHSILSYFISNPVSRAPGSLYRYSGYQSLFSILLRLSGDRSEHYRFFDHYGFVAACIILVAASIWICIKLPSDARQICIALLSSLALIVYPATLYFYGILLLIPMCATWHHRSTIPGRNMPVMLYWIAVALLMAVGTKYQDKVLPATCCFLAFALSWAVLAFVATQQIRALPRGLRIASEYT